MSALVLVFIAAATLLVYYNYFKDRKFWEKISKIKGKPTLPIIGNVHQFRTDSHGRFMDIIKMTEDLGPKPFRVKFGFDNNVILSSPEDIEVFMKTTTQIDKPKEYHFLDPWIGKGLLISTGAVWKRQRRVISPTFHFKILEQFIDVFEQHSTEFVKLLEAKRGKVIDICPMVTSFSLDAICETAMGVKVNAQKDRESDYVRAVSDICGIMMRRIFSGLSRIQWIFDLSSESKRMHEDLVHLHGLSNRVIINKRKELKDEIAAVFSSKETDLAQFIDYETKKYRPFIELLLLSKLPDGSPMDDLEIRNNVDTFIFAGHDTTTAGISFLLYNLSKYPDVQKQAFAEQVAMFGSDWEKSPTHSDLMEMKYLDRVIKESLRLYPSAPIIARCITEDVILPGGTLLPAGITVMLNVFSLHRHPEQFKNPDVFDPDRFLEDREKTHPFAYIPFSAGLRNCVGQKFAMLEIKTVVSKVLRRFELLSAGPEYEPQLSGDIILNSTNGINLILADRKY